MWRLTWLGIWYLALCGGDYSSSGGDSSGSDSSTAGDYGRG
jgi:hypothetical protein